MATSPISHFHQFWKSVTLSLRRTGWGWGGELWLLGIIILHSKNNSTLFINGRGQSFNILALNVPVHPIPSCFKCFIMVLNWSNCLCIHKIVLVIVSSQKFYNCLLTTSFLKIVVLKIVTFGSTNNFIWEYNVFKSQLTTLDHLPHLF